MHGEAVPEGNGGEHGSENAGVSSEMQVRILHTESPRIPGKVRPPWVSRDLTRGRKA